MAVHLLDINPQLILEVREVGPQRRFCSEPLRRLCPFTRSCSCVNGFL